MNPNIFEEEYGILPSADTDPRDHNQLSLPKKRYIVCHYQEKPRYDFRVHDKYVALSKFKQMCCSSILEISLSDRTSAHSSIRFAGRSQHEEWDWGPEL